MKLKVSPLKEAKVFDGGSDSLLNFDAKKSAIEALGYLVPNHLIRAALFERASQAENVTILNELMVDGVSTTNTGAEVSYYLMAKPLNLNWLLRQIVVFLKLGERWEYLRL